MSLITSEYKYLSLTLSPEIAATLLQKKNYNCVKGFIFVTNLVKTTRLTFSFIHALRTFRVPSIAGLTHLKVVLT